MDVTVQLYAGLRHNRFTARQHTCAESATVQSLLDELNIHSSQVGIVVVNQQCGYPDHALHDGDRVCVYPVIGGG